MNSNYLEKDLVDSATEAIHKAWKDAQVLTGHEFDYRAGRVDIVAVMDDGSLWAFEAKLSRWRDALVQAYRSTAFANFAYVVLPKSAAARASRCAYEFERRGVGLISVDDDKLETVLLAPRHETLQPWLTDAAVKFASKSTE